MARPGIKPRTSDLRVRCPTDCAARPGAMGRYDCNILGLCDQRWITFGETSTDGEHKVYSSGEDDRNMHGAGFLLRKDMESTVLICRPASSSVT